MWRKTGPRTSVVHDESPLTCNQLALQLRRKSVHPQNQSAIIFELKAIRSDRRVEAVEFAISEFVAHWIDKEPEYVKYFVDNYVNRKEQWAVCYRDISIPDTTAHAEAFHNLLKRVYSNKRNRYMKNLIERLMQIEEDFFIKFQG